MIPSGVEHAGWWAVGRSVGGSCPDPSPYECGTGGANDDDACDSEGTTEASTDESGPNDTSDDTTGDDTTGSDTSGGVTLELDGFVSCEGRRCEIDETFARGLHADPSPLLDQATRLVHDPELQRHVLHRVEPGSLAHALGLRSGDQLESVAGMVIHDLDSALRAYSQLGSATTLDVRVRRGSRWLDFEYVFVQ